MRVVGGGAMVAFRGPPGRHGPESFDRWFREQGWTPVAGWSRSGSTWRRRHTRAVGRRAQTIDVGLALDRRGRLSGLVMIAPLTPVDTKPREGES